MKNYEKPQLEISAITNIESIAGTVISEWCSELLGGSASEFISTFGLGS